MTINRAALGLVSALALISGAQAADVYQSGGGLKDGPVYAPNIWTGFYVGTHSAAVIGETNVADPFGPSIFGDKVRTPGTAGGVQLGYNYQFGRMVAGLEADASLAELDGTNTCFAASGFLVSSNCHSHTDAFGTLTARLGTTFGPAGHSLAYVKGGAAWEDIKLDSFLNGGVLSSSTSASETKWGWTVGAGIEHKITPHWSVNAEYDYMNFGDSNFQTPLTVVQTGPTTLSVFPPEATHFSNDLHVLKVGANYKLNGVPDFSLDEPGSLKDAPAAYAPAWEVEFGARYAGSWNRFQKDLGVVGVGSSSLASRLTYNNMWTNGGELFARIDTPQNIMIKGYAGLGTGDSGHMNDEDWAIPPGVVNIPGVAYSNTVSNTHDDIAYGTIDVGYDFMRGAGYKVAPFVGYTVMSENMKAFGCTQIGSPLSDCSPANPFSQPVPNSVAVITEDTTWQAIRLGSVAEFMLLPRLKLTTEAAWLPYVWFSGRDNHLLRNLVSPETGTGEGAQFEASLSYALTDHWNIGAGGRYTAEWTTSGNTNFGGTGIIVPMKFAVEQATGFAQLSYSFGGVYEPLK